MLLNISCLQKTRLVIEHVKITPCRSVWKDGSGSTSELSNEITKKKIANQTTILQGHLSEESVFSSAASKSLEMAISECIPQTKILINISKQSEFKINGKSKDLTQKSKNFDWNRYKKVVKNSKCEAHVKEIKTVADSSESLKNVKQKGDKNDKGPRLNEVNIQMLSKDIYQQLFGKEKYKKPSEVQVSAAQEELKKHRLLTSETPTVEEVNFKLPPLEGGTLQSHFQIIGEQQCGPYRRLLHELVKELPEPPKDWICQPGWTKYCNGQPPQSVPFPEESALVFDVEVCRNAGDIPTLATAASPNAWYAWVSESLFGGSRGGLGRNYSTKDLIPLESTHSQRGVGHGITKPRVVVGHNVSYDRARIKEQYWLESTGMRFVDTMSLHVCVSGVTSYQRALLKAASSKSADAPEEIALEEDEWRNYSSLNSLSEVHKLYCGSALDKTTRDLFVNGTLEEVKQQFQSVMRYCAGDVIATHKVLKELLPLFLSRFPHPVTLAGMLELSIAYLPLNSNWERYIADAQQTYEDCENEARFLLARRADEACKLLHEEHYHEDIWMWDQDWSVQELKLRKFVPRKSKSIAESKEISGKNVNKVGRKDMSKVQEIKKSEDKKENNSVYQEDESAEANELHNKFQYLIETKEFLPAKLPHLPGYPAWYRKLCPRPSSSDWIPGPQLISTSMQVTPKLLCLTWESYPLHYVRGHGWGFLVPYRSTSNTLNDSTTPHFPLKQLLEHCPIPEEARLMAGTTESEAVLLNLKAAVEENVSRKAFGKRRMSDEVPSWYKGNGVWCNVNVDDCCWFLKLPHKDGSNYRVGNPLAKDFINKFSENVLAGADKGAEKLLAIGRMLSYWRNNRERIEKQLVVWLNDRDLPRSLRDHDFDFGAIVPQVVICGTLTRRAVEPTWMTASNAHKERIGSELRAMIQAPPGYSIVGADVDSQELWIASLIGDAHFARIHGATPFGWMTLSGRKADGTDMHSVTAKAVGISRDHAKVINYARIYGAGQQFAERLLKQFNPSMSDVEARAKATKMFTLTKGKRRYRLKESYREILEDRSYSMTEALKLRAKHGVGLEEMFEHPQWTGGTESAMFNRLEEIANSEAPATPFLSGRLSRALEPKGGDDRYLPTRVNWVVQSGAVDFLHLMLVSMRWLLDSRARFCISFHDEVRYLVPDSQKYQAALALHVTNLLARAFCADQLGLTDLPQSIAFFASVEVDTVLRKEAHQDCCTPSNPHGLSRGYGIPHGESLDIYKSLQKAGGILKAPNRKNKKRPPEV